MEGDVHLYVNGRLIEDQLGPEMFAKVWLRCEGCGRLLHREVVKRDGKLYHPAHLPAVTPSA